MNITRQLSAIFVAGFLLLPIPAFAQDCPDEPADGSGVCVSETESETESQTESESETETEPVDVEDLASEDNGAPDTLSDTGVGAGVMGIAAVAAIGLGSGAVLMMRRRTDA